jgi:hypothetical protein
LADRAEVRYGGKHQPKNLQNFVNVSSLLDLGSDLGQVMLLTFVLQG